MTGASKFSLFKRSNGIYYVLFEQDGIRRWKSTGKSLKTEALKALTDVEELFREKSKGLSFTQFKGDLLCYVENSYAWRTHIIYSQAFEHLEAIVGSCSLKSLTAQHLDKYKTARLTGENPVQPVTVNIELRALKAAMNVAVRWKLLLVNPFASVKQLQVAERVPEFFTREQFNALLNVVSEQWLRDVILFAVSTGMRQAEILNLRWTDVDLSRKLIHIESNPTFKTKAGKRRTIPMSDVVQALLNARERRGEFVFMMKGRRVFESYLTHEFKAAVRLANLPESLHWHSLRHTHASYLVQAGVPILAVSKLLGHSSVRVTEKHYAALAPESLHDEVNRFSLN